MSGRISEGILKRREHIMPLYKYASFNDKTLENLENHALRFNTPEKFNDPFDIYPCFKIENRKKYNERLREKYRAPDCIISKLSDDDIIYFANIDERSTYTNSNKGITCFSKENDNIVMWANYADKHRGICLKFSDGTLKETTKKLYIKYPYSYERPKIVINLDDIEKDDKHLKKDVSDLISTKSHAWKYEKEVRLMIMDEHYTFPTCLQYEPRDLMGIILGAMMPVSDYLKFYKLKKESLGDISVSLSMLHKQKYKLEIKPINADEQKTLYQDMKYLIDNIITLKKYKFIKDNISKYGENKAKEYLQKAIRDMNLYTIKMCFDNFCQDTTLIDAIKDANNFHKDIYKFMYTLQYQVHYLAKVDERQRCQQLK